MGWAHFLLDSGSGSNKSVLFLCMTVYQVTGTVLRLEDEEATGVTLARRDLTSISTNAVGLITNLTSNLKL